MNAKGHTLFLAILAAGIVVAALSAVAAGGGAPAAARAELYALAWYGGAHLAAFLMGAPAREERIKVWVFPACVFLSLAACVVLAVLAGR